MTEPSSDDPKIIVDTDWKSQVQSEKEELEQKRQNEATSESSSSSSSSDEQEAAEPSETDEHAHELPEASFSMLVSTLVTQAAVSLGHVPDPVDGDTNVSKPMAKHIIDTLCMLEEKTKGNLSSDESQLLDAVLHQLRMAYMAV